MCAAGAVGGEAKAAVAAAEAEARAAAAAAATAEPETLCFGLDDLLPEGEDKQRTPGSEGEGEGAAGEGVGQEEGGAAAKADGGGAKADGGGAKAGLYLGDIVTLRRATEKATKP